MNSSLIVNRGLPAFARAKARQALIQADKRTSICDIRVISGAAFTCGSGLFPEFLLS